MCRKIIFTEKGDLHGGKVHVTRLEAGGVEEVDKGNKLNEN